MLILSTCKFDIISLTGREIAIKKSNEKNNYVCIISLLNGNYCLRN